MVPNSHIWERVSKSLSLLCAFSHHHQTFDIICLLDTTCNFFLTVMCLCRLLLDAFVPKLPLRVMKASILIIALESKLVKLVF